MPSFLVLSSEHLEPSKGATTIRG
uniref:Uncharacterized protein n=1 Tax=Rhizophora mucronata TaxID=61149 RepID=A0A2P2NU68_RHIMU